MTNVTVSYTSDYFASKIFETDYETLARIIAETYHPQTVVELGCGPGHLSRELAKLGIKVMAVDGYANPDFSGLSVEFHTLDLNESAAIENLLAEKYFDLAVSLEVAEHLQPQTSPTLVDWLTKLAPVVIFSAAVPGQGGHGHINLRPRSYWHSLFNQREFIIADRIRERLRDFPNIAPWYRYNVTDYVRDKHSQMPQLEEVICRLIASESAASTAYYEISDQLALAKALLSYAPVQWYFSLRNSVKRILGRR